MTQFHLPDPEVLLRELQRRDFRMVGPVPDDEGIHLGDIGGIADLAKGWKAEHRPGNITWRQGDTETWFDYAALLDSWKQYVFPSREYLWTHENGTFQASAPQTRTLALIGPRACDIAALKILDNVFLRGEVPDARYKMRRESLFIVAVECASAASTCFCSAMGSGPEVSTGADLVLFELDGSADHHFLLRTESERGQSILDTLHLAEADKADLALMRQKLAEVRRTTAWDGACNIPDHAEPMYYRHENWEQVAERCLSCANCTLACPTCFCFDLVHSGGVSQSPVCERQWSSCFDCHHSYIHGGAVRKSIASRYRQWLMHKLVTWQEQFGSSGCVGCGRCISACPAGIDLRREAENVFAIREEGSYGKS